MGMGIGNVAAMDMDMRAVSSGANRFKVVDGMASLLKVMHGIHNEICSVVIKVLFLPVVLSGCLGAC